jgi:hypothetical protein
MASRYTLYLSILCTEQPKRRDRFLELLRTRTPREAAAAYEAVDVEEAASARKELAGLRWEPASFTSAAAFAGTWFLITDACGGLSRLSCL